MPNYAQHQTSVITHPPIQHTHTQEKRRLIWTLWQVTFIMQLSFVALEFVLLTCQKETLKSMNKLTEERSPERKARVRTERRFRTIRGNSNVKLCTWSLSGKKYTQLIFADLTSMSQTFFYKNNCYHINCTLNPNSRDSPWNNIWIPK